MTPREVQVAQLAGQKVAVIGDAMLDSYLHGFAGRLCREAPVPIVGLGARDDAPGGAANTAANVRGLGGEVRLLSVVGADDEGDRLVASLEAAGVPMAHLVVDEGRQTLAKQRVIADGQLLLRLDSGATTWLQGPAERAVIERLSELYAWADALIVSDYGYGVVTGAVIDALARLHAGQRKPVVADAKDLRRLAPIAPTAVKPNYEEACHLLGEDRLRGAGERVAQMEAAADRLRALTGAENVVVTLDGEGSVLLRRGHGTHRTTAARVPNDHAAGAGDTFAACLALALSSGDDCVASVDLAAAAAALVVMDPGTSVCHAEDLMALAAGGPVLDDHVSLARRIALERRRGRRVVFTNGCFDILHSGHVDYLKRAKALGDVLVVAVNTDDSVRRLKGANRPVNTLADRLQVLGALGCVDYLVSFGDDTPEPLLRLLRPDVVAKGGDYTVDRLPEAALVRELGGEVRILPFVPDRSTTSLIERIGSGGAHGENSSQAALSAAAGR